MTYSKSVTIWCDGEGCDKWERRITGSAMEARKELREQDGWKYDSGEDYCPDCCEDDNPEEVDD